MSAKVFYTRTLQTEFEIDWVISLYSQFLISTSLFTFETMLNAICCYAHSNLKWASWSTAEPDFPGPISIRERCLGSMNLNHLCPIRGWFPAVNPVLIEFGQPFVHSNKLHVPLNRNYNVYARQRIQRPAFADAVRRTVAVRHCQYLLVHRQQQWLYTNHDSTVADANLCWTNENNEIFDNFKM